MGCSLPASVARHQVLGKLPAYSLTKNIRKDVHHGVTRPTEVPGPFTFGGKALRPCVCCRLHRKSVPRVSVLEYFLYC